VEQAVLDGEQLSHELLRHLRAERETTGYEPLDRKRDRFRV
jgi:hypothetical protein